MIVLELNTGFPNSFCENTCNVLTGCIIVFFKYPEFLTQSNIAIVFHPYLLYTHKWKWFSAKLSNVSVEMAKKQSIRACLRMSYRVKGFQSPVHEMWPLYAVGHWGLAKVLQGCVCLCVSLFVCVSVSLSPSLCVCVFWGECALYKAHTPTTCEANTERERFCQGPAH